MAWRSFKLKNITLFKANTVNYFRLLTHTFYSAKICKKSEGAPLPKILTTIYCIFTTYCCYPTHHCMLSVVYMLMGHMAYCIHKVSYILQSMFAMTKTKQANKQFYSNYGPIKGR